MVICGFLSVVVRHRDVSVVRAGFGLVGWLWWGASGDVDADLVLTFLVTGQVSWLPVGTAWRVLPLVTAVRVLGGALPVEG